MKVYIPVHLQSNGVCPIDSGSTNLMGVRETIGPAALLYAKTVLKCIGAEITTPMKNPYYNEGVRHSITLHGWQAHTPYGDPMKLFFGILEIEVNE